MTGTRRVLILIGLTLAIAVGGSIPASATFSERVSLPSVRVQTDVIQPATGVKAEIECYDRWTPYGTQRWMKAEVTWRASTSADVNRYHVQAVIPGVTTLEYTTSDTKVEPADQPALHQRLPVTVTVTALTPYGWTKVASPVLAYTC